LFAEGQAAFREATPDGYERAANAFRKPRVTPARSLRVFAHLAEALLFLALEQKLNQEDTAPSDEKQTSLTWAEFSALRLWIWLHSEPG